VRVRAKRFVVATGSRPALPPIPVSPRRRISPNESVWDNRTRPEHLVVIGAGPIGCELAQAHRRLGSAVTVLDQATLLPKDDPELAAVVKARLEAEGVALRLHVKVAEVAQDGAGVAVTIEDGGVASRIAGSHLLVAAGRTPNIEDLGSTRAGSRPRRPASPSITGCARQQEGLRDRRRRGRLSVHASRQLPRGPRDPQRAVPPADEGEHRGAALGHLHRPRARAGRIDRGAGARARRRRHDRALHLPGERSRPGRARDRGFIKVVAARGKVLGASIVGLHAGELIQPWVLAIQNGLKLSRMASLIAPYPTLAEVNKRAAGAFFTPKLFSERTRKLVRFLLRFA